MESLLGLLLGLGVFTLCLIGILSRPHVDLATFWPANAFALGMLVRFPSIARPLTWVSCAVGFFLADAIAGTELRANLLLNGGNLVSITTGYLLLAHLPREDRLLRRSPSILLLLRAIFIAAFATGLIGSVADPLLFGSTPLEGFLFWAASDVANYAAFLPIFLTLPSPSRFVPSVLRRKTKAISRWNILPLLALILSAAGSVLIGGPGAVAFPVPALLWCALTYQLFTTCCLSFVFGAWTMISIRAGIMPVGAELNSRSLLISARLGITLIALAPLVVGIMMAARNELLRQLQQLADHDSMTGLRNRRSFLETGTKALSTSYGTAHPNAVMMLDIDHFKSINDHHGHDAGDHVLVAFARILEQNLRPRDIVGRIGGEEFAVVLPDCSEADAKAVAERISTALRSASVELGNGQQITATVSIGIHMEHGEGKLGHLLTLADQALYRAKNAGRDRVKWSQAVA